MPPILTSRSARSLFRYLGENGCPGREAEVTAVAFGQQYVSRQREA